MSRPPTSQQESKPQIGFGAPRDTEFFRYLPPYHLQSTTPPHVNSETKPTDFVARSSSDPVLTAFAQLGALRLDSKRALISLFGRNEQHVLTEATRTLSLQNDSGHLDEDKLWIGRCTLSYSRSLCKAVMNPTQSMDNAPQLFVVPDLAQDEALSGHQDVVGSPNFRFLACSPIISPKGFVIGAYTILDDKPHPPLDASLASFMTDIANTVMDYLVATRSRYQHTRSERMMVGLGSFLEGKGSLRNTWIVANEDILSPEEEHLEGHVHREQQAMQTSNSAAHSRVADPSSDVLLFRPHKHNPSGDHKPAEEAKAEPLPADIKNGMQDYFQERVRRKRGNRTRKPFRRGKSNTESPKADFVKEVQETLSRAANIIRESIEVEAAVFFDADFTSQGALVNSSGSVSGSNTGSSAAGLSSSDEGDMSRMAQDEYAGPRTIKPCGILGYATSDFSSISNEPVEDRKILLSESFLAQLLRRYPKGKIFNYGEDGSISSDDTTDHTGTSRHLDQRPDGTRYKRTRKSILRQDAATLLQLAPNARSIAFSPLWDDHKERWFSGCLSWTKTAHRVLTSDDELAFLFAFGNSVMAEIHRLAALFAERAKSNLLAGISHELRSPLHGIFGTIDILNDTTMNVLQRGLMHTISSCAFTLLGSIDQLLDYASINDIRPHPHDLGLAKIGPGAKARKKSIDENSIVHLNAAIEDAIETVFAGHTFFKKKTPTSFETAHTLIDIRTRVRVILDIECLQNSRFMTRPGAWHVILTNIFGNAMKFTENGYINVSLKTNPVAIADDGQASHSRITLSIKDSGCGMDKEFLENKVFSAFSQEDTMSIGNGLGLNIVHRIISSLNGNIQITSHKGIGTNVVVNVTLEHAPYTPPRPLDMNKPTSPLSIGGLVSGQTVGILVPSSSDGDVALANSLRRLCEGWFSMNVDFIDSLHTRPSHCDIFISLHESLDIGNNEILPSVSTPSHQCSSPVIIICSCPSTAHAMFLTAQERKYTGILEFISQPCGPHKLAQALKACINRQQDQQHPNNQPNNFEASFSQAMKIDPKEQQQPVKRREEESPCTHIEITNNDPANLTPGVIDDSSILFAAGYSQDRPASIKEEPLREHEELESPSATGGTVLLVDDNDININLLIAFMRRLKFSYLVARNGQEAVDSFKENAQKISVILMDISMPVMNGIEATRRIREYENTLNSEDRAMIVALTGVAQAEMEREAIGSGMDTFLTKPVRLDVLGPVISRKIHESHLV